MRMDPQPSSSKLQLQQKLLDAITCSFNTDTWISCSNTNIWTWHSAKRSFSSLPPHLSSSVSICTQSMLSWLNFVVAWSLSQWDLGSKPSQHQCGRNQDSFVWCFNLPGSKTDGSIQLIVWLHLKYTPSVSIWLQDPVHHLTCQHWRPQQSVQFCSTFHSLLSWIN